MTTVSTIANRRAIRSFVIEKTNLALESILKELNNVVLPQQVSTGLNEEVLKTTIQKLGDTFAKAFSIDPGTLTDENFNVIFDQTKEKSPVIYVDSYAQYLLGRLDMVMKDLSTQSELFVKIVENKPEQHQLLQLQSSIAVGIANNISSVILKVAEMYIHHCKKNGYEDIATVEPYITKNYIFLDVETIGFEGKPFAFAMVVANPMGEEIGRYTAWYMPSPDDSDDYKWVQKNVVPQLEADEEAEQLVDLKGLMTAFRVEYAKYNGTSRPDVKKDLCILVADHPYPRETNFFDYAGIRPYPIIDISSMLMFAGKDPIACYERKEGETRIHHPLDDARQTMRMFFSLVNGRIHELQYRYDDKPVITPEGVSDAGTGE